MKGANTSKKAVRVAVAEFQQETLAVSPFDGDLANDEWVVLTGPQWAKTWATMGLANDIMHGFAAALRDRALMAPLHPVEIPLCLINGNSKQRPLPAATVHGLLEDCLLSPLRAAVAQAPIDGVLLSLHGSFYSKGDDDIDGTVLRQVRTVVGPTCTVLAVCDQHSNISQRMVDAASGIFIERTYPHVDMAERARAAVELLARTMRGEVVPVMAWCPVPLLWSAPRMITSQAPAQNYVRRLLHLDTQPSILGSSVGVGYQWQDSPVVGASALVIADRSHELAQNSANELGKYLWDHRNDWQAPNVSTEVGLHRGQKMGRFPIILADQSDNPGGGAASDSTEVMRHFQEKALQPAAVLYIWDPESVQLAHDAGVGATCCLDVGGKSHSTIGPPVRFPRAKILALADGKFKYDGPMYQDKWEDVGDCAHIEQDGLHIVLVSAQKQPIDLALCRLLELDCAQLKYICVKSTGHFRSGFGPIAGSIHNIDAQGIVSQDWSKVGYTRGPQDLYPLNTRAMLLTKPARL
jgi:microcystin degradation protein MlrC